MRKSVTSPCRFISQLCSMSLVTVEPTMMEISTQRFISVVFLAVSFYAFLALLQVSDLSFAVPATALSLVVETILAHLILKEQVTPARWAGVVLVAIGVWLLAL